MGVFNAKVICGTIGSIRLCGRGFVPVRGSLCLFWRETHAKGVRARLPTTLEEDEKRQGSRVNRTGQSTEEGSEQNRPVSSREQLSEVGGSRRSEKSDY